MATTTLARALQWFFWFMLVATMAGCGGGGGGSPSPDAGPGTNTGTVGPGSNTGTVGPGSNTGVQPGGGGGTALELGMESRVNTTTAGQQVFRSIGALTDGGYTVAWISGDTTLYIQRYDIFGNKVGGETVIPLVVQATNAPSAALAIANSSVAVLSDGSVVVAYSVMRDAPRPDGSLPMPSKLGVYFQRFDANGVPVMAEAEVVSRTEVIHSRSSGFNHVRALALADGGFVIGWALVDASSVDLKATIYNQRYDSQGQAIGGPVVVGGPHSQASYDFTADLRAGYAVSIFAGDSQGNPFVTVTHYDANQAASRIVTSVPFEVGFPALVLPLEGERYVLFASGSAGAYRQMLDAAGNPVGAPASIPSVPVAARELVDGSFVAFWADGTAQRYTSEGTPMGERLVTGATGTARGVVALVNGGAALAWSAASAAGDQDVYTQRLH